jgi:hypothetical protein
MFAARVGEDQIKPHQFVIAGVLGEEFGVDFAHPVEQFDRDPQDGFDPVDQPGIGGQGAQAIERCVAQFQLDRPENLGEQRLGCRVVLIERTDADPGAFGHRVDRQRIAPVVPQDFKAGRTQRLHQRHRAVLSGLLAGPRRDLDPDRFVVCHGRPPAPESRTDSPAHDNGRKNSGRPIQWYSWAAI